MYVQATPSGEHILQKNTCIITMDEAFANFYPCRANQDKYFGDPEWWVNIDDPDEWPYDYPDNWNQYTTSKPRDWNSWILASTMWDICQHVSWPNAWDEILWLPIESDEVDTHLEYRDRVVYWAGFWGGGYANYAIQKFTDHGFYGSSAPPKLPEVPSLPSHLVLRHEFALLQNFPNSFNPDTWIPYQLAEDVDVTIRIHDASAKLVRTLSLGHQPTGLYTTKEKAAYWDGKNEAGEQVSSGVYFYTIRAGDFTATKKMVVAQ